MRILTERGIRPKRLIIHHSKWKVESQLLLRRTRAYTTSGNSSPTCRAQSWGGLQIASAVGNRKAPRAQTAKTPENRKAKEPKHEKAKRIQAQIAREI